LLCRGQVNDLSRGRLSIRDGNVDRDALRGWFLLNSVAANAKRRRQCATCRERRNRARAGVIVHRNGQQAI
jgi:hypothetical protein